MKAWHFGNTTVRSALRLRDGLITISNYKLEGNIRGVDGDSKLRSCLGESGLVTLGSDQTNSVGRKWRSAMEKMGFLIPRLPSKHSDVQEHIGPPDFISKNGHTLINSDNLQTWQECYLRALSAYRIANDRSEIDFSPFSFVLKVMLILKMKTGTSRLNKDEMALFVELAWYNEDASHIAENIILFREEINKLDTREKEQFLAKNYLETNLKPSTLKNDYADTNFRYLKSTGLFKSSRTSILIDEDKLSIATEISEHFWMPQSLNEYYKGLCDGAPLPTDNFNVAKNTALSFSKKLNAYGIETSEEELNSIIDVAQINAKRYEFEERLFQIREVEFASQQAELMDEIIAYINLLLENKNSTTLENGDELEIPKADRPAYFEWIVWRAFLAINSIINPPWESRNFKIDPDFKPISHAASGTSDLIFEFDDFVLVVEVTLTQSSRQEAAEGEPVRRHVAKFSQKYANSKKEVYGLFLAITIDTNTANTFRLGEWYLPDDKQINVHIVPVRLDDFKYFLESGKSNPSSLLNILQNIIIKCRLNSGRPAPDWKKAISEQFRLAVVKTNY